jgi:hypothetical protein
MVVFSFHDEELRDQKIISVRRFQGPSLSRRPYYSDLIYSQTENCVEILREGEEKLPLQTLHHIGGGGGGGY